MKKLSRSAKKRLASLAAILVLAVILTNPTYHSGRPKVDVNGTSDYYEVYYGNRTAGVKEVWLEFHSPFDLFAYYYCEKRPGLQVGYFVLGPERNALGAGGIAPNASLGANSPVIGNASGAGDSALSDQGAACFGFISPIPARGELDPYGSGWRVCYGLRLVESRSCAY